MDKKQNNKHTLLPFSVIEAAVNGNVDAINAVLKHYEPYIAALATRRLYDENGVPHLCVDDELRKTLEIKLITKILSFELVKAA
ncbi:MAG: helix-turn-helix domain-containing protein [Vescimonas coprocola]|nr:helix-turn-helix domain-containing protein [Clostridia bacterium]MDY2966915.1 helix-turn-helix domain-containing protein [Vescimonas coprocola]